MDRLREKLAGLLHPCPTCGCWLYTGRRVNRNGYARVWKNGREPVLHRVVWELLIGPIDDGLLLDHKCRTRLCSNPDHLEPVTTRVNTLRGEAVLFKRGGAYADARDD